MRAISMAILVLVTSCYQSPPSSCAIRCTTTCPDGLSCVQGFCVTGGTTCETAADASTTGITIDDYSSTNAQYMMNLRVPHMIGAGSNRLLVVGVSTSYSGTLVTAMTYGSATLTQLGAVDAPYNDGRVELWSLVNPPVGTAMIDVTFTDNYSSNVIGVASYFGVNPTAPLGAFTSAQGYADVPSVTVPAADGDLVLSVVMFNAGYTSLSPDTPQTSAWNLVASDMIGAGSTQPGSASVTSSWTVAGGYSDMWAIGSVAIKP